MNTCIYLRKSRADIEAENKEIDIVVDYPDIGNMKNAAVLYGTDVVDDLRTGTGHIYAAHLKETLPGVYRDMTFGSGGHTEYTRCIQELWNQGIRIFTGEFWYLGSETYEQDIVDAGRFLRGKIDPFVKL